MSVTGEAQKKKKPGRGLLGCFCLIFVVAGFAILPMIVWPMVQTFQAKHWRATPCRILMSSVEEHRGNKGGRTYKVVVSYRYEVDDVEYRSDRYQFFSSSSSGYEAKKEIVDRLRPLSETICYVNPRDPKDAVIDREMGWEFLFVLMPLAFIGLGLVAFFAVMKTTPGARSGVVAATPTKPAGKGRPGSLRSTGSPFVKFVVVSVFAVFWNGIVSLFLWQMIQGWRSGHGDGCLAVFLVPFELIGLALLGFMAYSFLSLFNPRPRLRVTSGELRLGREVEIEWETPGSVDRVKSFSILLQGREEVTYRRGTSTATDRSVFERIELARSPRGRDLRRGKAKVLIPATTMHTFRSRNNRVIWTIALAGEIPCWPDVAEEFEVEMLPQEGGPA